MSSTKVRVGVDIGGTFTDIALEHSGGLSSCKVLTNYAQPEQAILDGINKAARQTGIQLAAIDQVIHGTTLVTNSLIERRGAKLAFITTEGFRDVVEMRSENRFEQYDLNLRLPTPLVTRADRYTLKERLAADGSVLLPLNPREVAALIEDIVAKDYQAVAIGFIHAYVNGDHERQVADTLRRAAPHISISISSVVSPRMREFERFNTVIANAYVQPHVSAYLNRLVDRLRLGGVRAPVFMMHSGGGLVSVETAAAQPVRLLESGPAGGAIFAAEFARTHGLDKVLSFDMGGTTAKICLIEEGTPTTASTLEVARTYRFKKGSGMLVSTPVVEMVEIGAGGGSIASLDILGRIQVGPRSAASEPGPACYQRGGEEPTVTDANLVLGRLDAENFAGGEIPLSLENAERSLTAKLGSAAGTARGAASSVTEVVDENMANAARAHAIESGRDIEAFTMIAFGGGAPLHACRQCEKLGIDALIIPPGAGVGSAIGFLRAPFSYEASRGYFQRVDDLDHRAVDAMLAQLEEEATAFVAAAEGERDLQTRLTAYMRYTGQGWEIPVVLPRAVFSSNRNEDIKTTFERSYRTLFGRIIDRLSIEITNWSLMVASALPDPKAVTRSSYETEAPVVRRRQFFDAGARRRVEAAEVLRRDMLPGAGVAGPAVIVEDETSTIVTSAFQAVGQEDGSLLLTRKEVRS
jgi:N-methylhydantoinase A